MINTSSDQAAHGLALAIVGLTFLSALVIIVHGFLVDPHYQIPVALVTFAGPILGAALTYIGWSSGTNTVSKATFQAIQQVSAANRAGYDQGVSNGHTEPAKGA